MIYCEDLEPKLGKLNRELLLECHQIRDYDAEGQKWSRESYPGGYTSYSSLCQLHKMSSTFGMLEKKIDRHVRRFAEALEFNLKDRTIAMTDCWINVMPRQVVHGLHLHPLSFLSGTYYVQTPPGSASIKFEDPRLSKFMAAPPRKSPCRPENEQFVKYKATAGKLILFESWLRHEVPSNQSDQDRISISFNYHWS